MSPAKLAGEREGGDPLCERACQLERSFLQTGELTRRLSMAVGSSVACVRALRRRKSAGSCREESEKASDEVVWSRGATLQSCKVLEGCTEVEVNRCSTARDSRRDELSAYLGRREASPRSSAVSSGSAFARAPTPFA